MLCARTRTIGATSLRRLDGVLVVSRFRVDEDAAAAFLADSQRALDALSARPGYRRGSVGRATDDPTLWVLLTQWQHVGAYRRALSSYDVRVGAVPLLSRALDEPSAYETLIGEEATPPNEARARGDQRA
jgi:quinol monooxygenase YgiN